MDDDPEITTHRISTRAMQDDFARELGYDGVDDLIAKAEAERAKLAPGTRAIVDEVSRRVERSVLGL
jgi:hypothetical protein